MAKYNNCMYNTGSSCERRNMNIELIKCEDKFCAASNSKVLYKNKVIYISLLPRTNGMETIICKYFVLIQHQKKYFEWKMITFIITNVQKVKIW